MAIGSAPEANKEVFDDEGYFRTGDMFEISSDATENKFYKYCGRCKDLIIRGGMNISPEELDNVIDVSSLNTRGSCNRIRG